MTPGEREPGTKARCCPRCHGEICRGPVRLAERLLSLFIAVRRYRCRAMGCGWEGNLRVGGAPAKASLRA